MQREAARAWLAHSVTLATASSLPRAAVPCESGCFFGTATIRGADIVGPPLRELRRALSASALGPSQKVPDKKISRLIGGRSARGMALGVRRPNTSGGLMLCRALIFFSRAFTAAAALPALPTVCIGICQE